MITVKKASIEKLLNTLQAEGKPLSQFHQTMTSPFLFNSITENNDYMMSARSKKFRHILYGKLAYPLETLPNHHLLF